MKKMLLKITSLMLVTSFMLPTLLSCKREGDISVPSFSDDTIKIGLTGPLTGAAAVYGMAVYNSAKLAVSEINASGGLGGVKLSLKMYDDQHKSELVAGGYANLLENGMQISLGTVTTKPGLEFKELSNEDNIFVLTPAASGDAIPEYDNAFQMCFADSNQGTASAEYFNQHYKGKRIGVFYKSDDEYSTGILKKFEQSLDQDFLEITKASFKGEESDFSQQVHALRECDVIFMPIYHTPASQFMNAGRNVIKPNAIYYGCDGLDGIDTIGGYDISKIPQEISYLSHFNSKATSGAAADFIAKYNATFNTKAQPLNQFGAAAYDCVYAIFYALREAVSEGKSIDGSTAPSEICNILSEKFSGDFVFAGITGKPDESGKSSITWTADGYVNKEAVKYVVKEANK